MAYISQEKKAEIATVVKAICKRYGVKGTLAVRHHSTLVLNIKEAKIDFIGNYNTVGKQRSNYVEQVTPPLTCLDVNPHWYQDHFDGKAKEFLREVLEAMNQGNFDNSDIMTDYFSVGWYVNVNIGRWSKPFVLAE